MINNKLNLVPSICIPFVDNDTKHYSEQKIVSLYFKFIDGDIYQINIDHPDVEKNNIDIGQIILNEKTLVLNKKLLVHNGILGGIDLNTYFYYTYNDVIKDTEFYSVSLEALINKFKFYSKLYTVIPYAKFIEYCENITQFILTKYSPDELSDKCLQFCNDFFEAFTSIERNRLNFSGDELNQFYNWFTLTSRPSNTWAGINFCSLNKTSGVRNQLCSKYNNGKILQFDYDAFHIKLLANILKYDFTGNPYEQLKQELNLNISYSDMKKLIFKNIYGGIQESFISHPLFARIQILIDELNDSYIHNDKFNSWFYRKPFTDIKTPTPNKIFNYYIQSLETEYNVKKILILNKLLDGKKSKLILYLYDAFIFDIHPDEMNIIETLENVFKTDTMTVKKSIGDNFGQLYLIQ
ncbi:hypothetical protein [Microcystis phage Mel-JY01]